MTAATRSRRNPRGAGRVVITDAEQRCVLATARGLARAGFEVTVLATAPKQVTLWSRACHYPRLVTDPRADCARFRQDVQEVLGERDCDVLIPGTEQTLLVLADAPPEELHGARHGIPGTAAVERSLDKRVLGEAASAVGMSSPASVVCETHAAAAAAASWFGYEVVIKPVRSVYAVGAGLRWRKSAMANGAEACRRAILGFQPPILVQRQLPHRAVLSFSGVVHRGVLYAGCLSRYRRSWPPQGGVAAFAETVPPPPALVEAVSRLVSEIGWDGIFEVEMLDPCEGGPPAVVDLNPRLFGTIGLPIATGANLPAVWCRVLMGDRPPVAWATPNGSYRFEEADLRFLLYKARRRHWRPALTAALPQPGTTHALFDRRDPLPFLAWAISAGRVIRPPHAADGHLAAPSPVATMPQRQQLPH